MKITIIASGSRGDVQPYVALGAGLKKAGHDIRFVTTQDFQDFVLAHGLAFVTMGGSAELRKNVQNQMQDIIERGNLFEILAQTAKGAEQLAHDSAVSGLQACDDADFILAGLGGLFVGLALSEKLGIPLIQAHLMPFTPTRAFASVLTPLPQSPITRPLNRFSHHITRQAMWQMMRRADAKVRADVLKLDTAPFGGPFARLERQTRVTLYGYSAHVIPRPADWSTNTYVTGYWFVDPLPDWSPPSDLTAFINAGAPPVYVGFGSMPSRKPDETTAMILQALSLCNQRAVLSEGWGALQRGDLPDTVYMLDSIPHRWLFPKMGAIVHHGGAGTTGAGFASGVPSIITPFFGDQPFWGKLAHMLGVGPPPIVRQRLTAANLAEAIQCAMTDTCMRKKAAILGAQLQNEDGVAQAVKVMENLT